MIIVFYLFGFLMAVQFCGIIQNYRVYVYRQKILNFIYHKNMEEIHAGKDDIFWRNIAYDEVSYGDMLYKFWKPFDSFFPQKLIDEMRKQPEYCRKQDITEL